MLLPGSQLGPITAEQRQALIKGSLVAGTYDTAVDRQSAYELLAQRGANATAGATGTADASAGAGTPEAQGGGMFDGIGTMVKEALFGRTGPRGGQYDGLVQNIVKGEARRMGRELLRGALGSLIGGKRFWALAETGNKADIVGGDEVGGYLLLTTSVDGTMSTQARFTSIRVVCNNTLTVALAGNAKRAVKMTHHKEFDPKQTKIDLGLLSTSWAEYTAKLQALSKISMDEAATRKFYQKVFFDPKKTDEDQGISQKRLVDTLMEKAFNGIGSDMSRGTAWGALNGATELYTHWKGNRDASAQFWDGFAGDHAAAKEMVLDQLSVMIA